MARIGSRSWLRVVKFILEPIHIVYGFLIVLLITLLYIWAYSGYLNIITDAKIAENEVKGVICKQLLEPTINTYDYMNDEKILTSRKVLKSKRKYDHFTLCALGFELDSCKIWSKQKTSLEINLERVNLLRDNWYNDKWWYSHKQEYLDYVGFVK